MNRREFLASSAAAAVATAIPLPVAPLHVGIDMAAGPSSTIFYLSTPQSDGTWVWEMMTHVQKEGQGDA